MGDILSMTNYVTDMDGFLAAGDIRRTFLTEPYPVTTTMAIAQLYDRALVVEISVIAEIPPGPLQAAITNATRFKQP
jgi:2-iminobutanoate/2-iminopropanoate deaminase